MVRNFLAIITIVALVVSGMGCATTNPDGAPSPAASAAGGAVGGAALGAALGALLGLATGDVARSAVVGAIAGAAAGGIAGLTYGHYLKEQYRNRQTAEAFYQYDPQQGEKVVIDQVSVQPEAVAPGSQVTLESIYTILNGNDQPVPVEVTQGVINQGKFVYRPAVNSSQQASGSYRLALPFSLGSLPEGKYTFLTQVKAGQTQGTRACDFYITRNISANRKEIRAAKADVNFSLPAAFPTEN
ncbi:MAG: hypothetical protein FJ135_03270 [Deltaproteobacteria bacterium]|nr:hypothetical protein [Deltaproteobacteria bacterium]